MSMAQDYEELRDIAGRIKNDSLRVDVDLAIDQCEEDGDDIDTCYSVVTSDLMDPKANNNNDADLSECDKLKESVGEVDYMAMDLIQSARAAVYNIPTDIPDDVLAALGRAKIAVDDLENEANKVYTDRD
jgi:hypothetical protein